MVMDHYLSAKFESAVQKVLDSGRVKPRDPTQYFDWDMGALRERAKLYNVLLTQVFLERGKVDQKIWTEHNKAGEKVERGFPGLDFSEPVFEDPEFRAKFLNDVACILDAVDAHLRLSEAAPQIAEEIDAVLVSNEFEEHFQNAIFNYQQDAPTMR